MDKDTTCASVRPTCFADDASRSDISVISSSVVANLLPRSTIVDPKRSQLLIPDLSISAIPMIFANFASLVAASSALRLVDTSMLIIVSVKSVKLSVAIPSCPAISMTFAISEALDGITLVISRISCRSFAY